MHLVLQGKLLVRSFSRPCLGAQQAAQMGYTTDHTAIKGLRMVDSAFIGTRSGCI